VRIGKVHSEVSFLANINGIEIYKFKDI